MVTLHIKGGLVILPLGYSEKKISKACKDIGKSDSDTGNKNSDNSTFTAGT